MPPSDTGAAAGGGDAEAVAVAVRHRAGGPFEGVAAAAQRAQVQAAGHDAGGIEDLDLHLVGGRAQIEAADADTVGHRQPVAGDGDVAPDQRRALQRLQLHQLAVQAGHGGVELLDAADGVDLRHLAGDLRVVQRVQRVLVLHLRDQQLEEAVFAAGLVLGRRRGAAGGGRCSASAEIALMLPPTLRVARHGGVRPRAAVRAHDCPICSVFSSRLLAAFITSRLFW